MLTWSRATGSASNLSWLAGTTTTMQQLATEHSSNRSQVLETLSSSAQRSWSDLSTTHTGTLGEVTAAPSRASDLWNFSLGLNWTWYNFSLSEDISSGIEPYSLPGAVLTGLALGFIVLMTIIGNVLVLLAVFVNSHLRGTTHYFIANLALADLLLGTTVLPFSASLEIIQYWAFGQIFCDIWAAVDVLCCTASILSLCVISIDRYIGVTRPLQHSTIMNERRAGYIILAVWLLSSTISVAPLLGWKEPPPDDPTVCEVTKQLGYVLFSVSGSFYIPLIIILVVYFRVYREALSQSRCLTRGVKTFRGDEANKEVTLRIHTGTRPSPARPPNHYQSSSSSEHSQESGRKNQNKLTLAGKVAKFNREKKAAKTLGIVVGVFIMCWFPFFFILPLESLCSSCYVPMWLFKVIFWLGYCNSMMNPIIYACSSREFKRAFIRILKCQCKRKRRYFLDETSVTVGTTPSNVAVNATEMSNISRLNRRLKKLTRRQVKRKRVSANHCHCKEGPACQSLLRKDKKRQPNVCKNCLKFDDSESPIATLRLLYKKQKRPTVTVDNVVISDEDSVVHEQSDDESSGAEDKYFLSGSNAVTSPIPQNSNSVETEASVHHKLPETVIDEVADSKCSTVVANHTHQFNKRVSQRLYHFDDDNIMWL